jgi:hypothetical protein
MSQSQ